MCSFCIYTVKWEPLPSQIGVFLGLPRGFSETTKQQLKAHHTCFGFLQELSTSSMLHLDLANSSSKKRLTLTVQPLLAGIFYSFHLLWREMFEFFSPQKTWLDHPVGFQLTAVVWNAQTHTVSIKIKPVHSGYGTCANAFSNNNNNNTFERQLQLFQFSFQQSY